MTKILIILCFVLLVGCTYNEEPLVEHPITDNQEITYEDIPEPEPVPTQEIQPEPPADWAIAYEEILQEQWLLTQEQWDFGEVKFILFDFNNTDVPELLIFDEFIITRAYTFIDGEAIALDVPPNLWFEWYARPLDNRDGMIVHDYECSPSGWQYIKLIVLDGDSLVIYADADWGREIDWVNWDSDNYQILRYHWNVNGEAVDESEFFTLTYNLLGWSDEVYDNFNLPVEIFSNTKEILKILTEFK